ncbi:MAG: hypothetical protein KDA93_08085 [Planctomycetaceae bacterium]|nr:hypothetical protein [Planctomycetaceae bacterium]
MNKPAPPSSADEVIVRRLRWLTCIFAGVLVAATWPLWKPISPFPEIPWMEHWVRYPRTAWDVSIAGNLPVFLLLQLLEIKRTWLRRSLNAYFAVTGLIYLLFDQHRLQPWVVQMLILTTLLAFSSARTGVRCARLLVVSIYVHSALSKVDVAFLDSHGQFLLDGLTTALGLSTELWSETARRALTAMFPVGELLAALCLTWPRSRRLGLILAILMHVMLLLTLGPWGHGHHAGVLIWNVYFILLDLLIFRQTTPEENAMTELPDREFNMCSAGVSRRVGIPAAWAGTMFFVFLPCLNWWGLWDHWPSWAVYSSRPSIVEVYVPEGHIERLPTSLQTLVSSPEPLSDQCRVNLDAWSFEMLRCPMYPQERYRVAVALALSNECHIDAMRLVIHSSPDRWTGEREAVVLKGTAEIQARADSFWLNTKARLE